MTTCVDSELTALMTPLEIATCAYTELPALVEVLEGELDLFILVPDEQEKHYSRVLYRSLKAGEILFCPPDFECEYALLACATTDSRFRGSDNLGPFERESETLAPLLLKWLNFEYAELLDSQSIEFGKYNFDTEELISSEHLGFARMRSGEARFGGRTLFGEWLPVGPGWTLQLMAGSELELVSITDLMASCGYNTLINATAQLMAAQAVETVRLHQQLEASWIEQSIWNDVDLVAEASGKIEQVFNTHREHFFRGVGDDDAVFACVQAIGRYLELDIVKPVYVKPDLPVTTYLQGIAESSKVRMRRVKLDSGWIREDNGPLLGFLKDSGEPVALIPEQNVRYRMFTADGHEKGIVDRSSTDLLEDFAFIFYRTFQKMELNLRNIFRFGAFGNRDTIMLLIIVGLLGGLLSIATPVATNLLFSTVIPSSDHSQLLYLTGGMGAMLMGSMLFGLVRSLTTLRLQTLLNNNIQAAIWDHLLRLPVMFFSRYNAGDLAIRANSINKIREILAGSTITVILSSIFSVFSLGLMFFYSAKMAMISLLYMFAIVLVSALFIVRQHRLNKEILEYEGEMNGFMFQLISGIAKIKNSAAENRAFFQWSSHFSRQQSTMFKMNKLNAGLATFNAIIPVGATLLLFIGVGFFSVTLNAGQFVGFNSALGQFIGGFSALIMVIPDLLEIKPLYKRVQPVLDQETETHDEMPPMEPINGRLEIQNVCYRYPGAATDTLKNVSLQAKPGEFIALVGSSGSGKSTLLKLMLGFDKPSTGSLFYGNIDMNSRDIPSLRRQIGVVLQKSKIYPGSILENVIGNLPLSTDDAMDALEAAGFKDDLEQFPMGLHTVIGEAGSLSGGQKQRILIARALVNRPKILLFDEATSALDNKTQKIVSESLDQLQATRIVIAHRLSTVQGADRIYVMDKGVIIEQGSYAELIAQRGVFYDLAERQIA